MNDRRLTDLLYLQKELDDKIFSEINKIYNGKSSSIKEIKDSLLYVIEKRLEFMRLDEENES